MPSSARRHSRRVSPSIEYRPKLSEEGCDDADRGVTGSGVPPWRAPARAAAAMTDEALANRPGLGPAAAEGRPRRFQIRITRGLLVGFGGLVALAVLAVLALGMWSAWRNTTGLLRDRSEATISVVLSRIDRYLQPAEDQLAHLASQIGAGKIDTAEGSVLPAYLSGALAATPQVRSVVFIDTGWRMAFALRDASGVAFEFTDVGDMPVIRDAAAAAYRRGEPFWGEVIFPETAGQALLNLRHPVFRDGRPLGLLAASIRVDALSTMLDDTGRELGGRSFVLFGDGSVLAHAKLASGDFDVGPRKPLPSAKEVADPVLLGFLERGAGTRAQARIERTTGVRLVTVDGRQYGVLFRETTRYGDRPWLVGVAFPAADILDELLRLRWAAAAGLAVLLLSLLFAYLFAR